MQFYIILVFSSDMYAKLAFIKLLTAGTTNAELPHPSAAGETSVKDLKVLSLLY